MPKSEPLKILVVDDEIDCADALVAFLRLTQYRAQAVYGGKEALALATEFQPDIVFLDITMPRMNGYATASELRKMFGSNPPLLIAFTALSQPAEISAMKDAGFDLHLGKPCEFDNLLQLMEGAISGHSEGRKRAN